MQFIFLFIAKYFLFVINIIIYDNVFIENNDINDDAQT